MHAFKSSESYWAIFSYCYCYYTLQGGFKTVDETLVCDNSNESSWAVLSCDAVCFHVFCKLKWYFFQLLNALWNEWKGVNWQVTCSITKTTYSFFLLNVRYKLLINKISSNYKHEALLRVYLVQTSYSDKLLFSGIYSRVDIGAVLFL